LAVVTNAAVTACGIFGAYRLVRAGLVLAWRGATRAAGRPECGARVCGAVAVGAELAGPGSLASSTPGIDALPCSAAVARLTGLPWVADPPGRSDLLWLADLP
jgi:hypothetical protein